MIIICVLSKDATLSVLHGDGATGHWHYPNISFVQGGLNWKETIESAAVRLVHKEANTVIDIPLSKLSQELQSHLHMISSHIAHSPCYMICPSSPISLNC